MDKQERVQQADEVELEKPYSRKTRIQLLDSTYQKRCVEYENFN